MIPDIIKFAIFATIFNFIGQHYIRKETNKYDKKYLGSITPKEL